MQPTKYPLDYVDKTTTVQVPDMVALYRDIPPPVLQRIQAVVLAADAERKTIGQYLEQRRKLVDDILSNESARIAARLPGNLIRDADRRLALGQIDYDIGRSASLMVDLLHSVQSQTGRPLAIETIPLASVPLPMPGKVTPNDAAKAPPGPAMTQADGMKVLAGHLGLSPTATESEIQAALDNARKASLSSARPSRRFKSIKTN